MGIKFFARIRCSVGLIALLSINQQTTFLYTLHVKNTLINMP